MKRKTVASIHLLLAGIVMVLSLTVPHHHHEELICFTAAHCADPESGEECRHEHDAPQEKDAHCFVQSLFQAELNRGQQAGDRAGTAPAPDFPPLPAAIAEWAGNRIILAGTGARVFPKPHVERLHASDWRAGLAGRAPPAAMA